MVRHFIPKESSLSGLKKNEDVEIVEWNEQKIEVKQYLPIEDKLKLITAIIQNSTISTSSFFFNPNLVNDTFAILYSSFYTSYILSLT